MANLKQMIEANAGDEHIEAVVIGPHYNDTYGDEKRFAEKLNRVLSWEEAASVLDVEYDNGYGGADTHPVTVWTASRVIFVHEYDGATNVVYVPRHPIDHEPQFGGTDGPFEAAMKELRERKAATQGENTDAK